MGRKPFPSDVAANGIVNGHTLICSAFHTIWSSWGDAVLEDSCRILWTWHFRNFLEQMNTSHRKYSNSNKQNSLWPEQWPQQAYLCTYNSDYCLKEGDHVWIQSIRPQQSSVSSQLPELYFHTRHESITINSNHSHCSVGHFQSILMTNKQ